MQLIEKIMSLYPELEFSDFWPNTGTIRLRDDGHGAYIHEWNHPTLPRPTKEQLDAIKE